MEAFTYKGIAEGKYVEGEIEALNQDEASHKLKEQKVIITNLIKSKKKKADGKAKAKKGGGLSSLFSGKKKSKSRGCSYFFKTICNHGKGGFTNFRSSFNVERSA